MRKLFFILFLLVLTCILVSLAWPCILHRDEGVRRIDAEMNALMSALQQYKVKYGAYPTGDSADISRALTGHNKDKDIFLVWRTKSTAANGELMDPWGTPYMIYFCGMNPLIRSAGPNKRFDSSRDKGFDDIFGE